MVVHSIEILIGFEVRLVFVELSFGMTLEKDLIKKVTGETFKGVNRGVTDFLNDWNEKR